MERSLVVMSGSVARTVALASTYVHIGREQNNDLVVDDCEISRSHALILCFRSSTLIADQSSLNGVYVNGRKVRSATLRHGDSIRMGSTEMRYRELSIR